MFSTDPLFDGPRATHTREIGSRHWLEPLLYCLWARVKCGGGP